MKLLWLIVLGISLSCGEDNRNSAKDNYKLRVLGLANEFSQGTEVSVQVEVLKNSEVATDKTTNIRMVVTCNGKTISTQSIQLNAGKASFGAFTVSEVGDCSVVLTTDLTSTETIKFVVKEKVDLNLPNPTPPNSGDPTQPNGKVSMPTFKERLTIGKPFTINSSNALKVQPDSLCENSIMLIYYDGSKVMEALTSGVHVPAVNGKISGLTLISIEQPPNIDKCGGEKGKLMAIQDKLITMSIMPGYPKGVSAKLSMPANPPNLKNVSFSNSGGKIKLTWGAVEGFTTNGAEIFFSNSKTGNEFTKHTAMVSWTNNGSVTATHNYSQPVRALVRVNISNGVHWLYFSS